MKKGTRKFVRNWNYLGMTLIAILAFWAGDWWSWNLIVTIPVGIIAYYSVAIPIAGAAVMAIKSEEVKPEDLELSS